MSKFRDDQVSEGGKVQLENRYMCKSKTDYLPARRVFEEAIVVHGIRRMPLGANGAGQLATCLLSKNKGGEEL